jgi:hypothetical protein
MDGCGVWGGWRRWRSWGEYEGRNFGRGGSKPLYSLGFGGRKALLSIPNGATARYLPKWVVALVLLGQKLPGLPLPNQAVQEAHTGKPSKISPIAYLGIWHNTTLPGSLALSVCMFILGGLEH